MRVLVVANVKSPPTLLFIVVVREYNGVKAERERVLPLLLYL